MTYTKEQLIGFAENIIATAAKYPTSAPAQADKSLAEIALAALTAEPVAYMYKDKLHNDPRFSLHTRFGNWSQEDINEYEITEIPLYAAPPAPVVPDIGEIRVGRLPTMNQDDYPGLGDWWVQLRIGEDSDEVLARVYGATPQEANSRAETLACRAAMLQGAELVTKDSKLPFEQWISQQTGTIDVECGCVMTEVFFHWLRVAYEAGNTPVIPAGYALVPIEPTEDMVIHGFESVPHPLFQPADWDKYQAMSGCEQAAHRAKLCWAAMIAAVPQQEVK